MDLCDFLASGLEKHHLVKNQFSDYQSHVSDRLMSQNLIHALIKDGCWVCILQYIGACAVELHPLINSPIYSFKKFVMFQISQKSIHSKCHLRLFPVFTHHRSCNHGAVSGIRR